MRGRGEVIRHDVAGAREPEVGNARQHAALARNRVGQHHVERAQAVGGDDQHVPVVARDRVDVAHLALVDAREAVQVRLVHRRGTAGCGAAEGCEVGRVRGHGGAAGAVNMPRSSAAGTQRPDRPPIVTTPGKGARAPRTCSKAGTARSSARSWATSSAAGCWAPSSGSCWATSSTSPASAVGARVGRRRAALPARPNCAARFSRPRSRSWGTSPRATAASPSRRSTPRATPCGASRWPRPIGCAPSNCFTAGKQADFPLEATLERLRRLAGNQSDLCRLFVQIQLEAAIQGNGLERPSAGRLPAHLPLARHFAARICVARGHAPHACGQLRLRAGRSAVAGAGLRHAPGCAPGRRLRSARRRLPVPRTPRSRRRSAGS